ncbi:MAG: DUF4384 domain-containing protein [Deltaproteobacteria bacterium]|nr:DUF4384 domain-containing protein [Deltaproteobacteria bacterium]
MQMRSVKKAIPLLLSLLLVIWPVNHLPAQPSENLSDAIASMAKSISSGLSADTKLRVAVAQLKTIDSKTSFFGKLVAEKLTNELIKAGGDRYVVMERSLVDRIMGERIDLNAEQAHELLKADILVSGTYTVLAEQVDVMARAINLSIAQAVAAGEASISLKTVQTLLDSDEISTTPKTQDKTISLRAELFVYKLIDGQEREVLIKSGDTLYTGDQFKINFAADKDCYLYVINYDNRNQVNVLFPHPRIALENRIEKGKSYSLPGGNLVYFADEYTGLEYLYVVAELKPMKDIDVLLARMQKAAGEEKQIISRKLKEAMGSRGFGVEEKREAASEDGGYKVMDVIKGHVSVLKAWEIVHK